VFFGIPRGFDQTVNDELGRRHIGRAHIQADNIHAFGLKFGKRLIQRCKKVRFDIFNGMRWANFHVW